MNQSNYFLIFSYEDLLPFSVPNSVSGPHRTGTFWLKVMNKAKSLDKILRNGKIPLVENFLPCRKKQNQDKYNQIGKLSLGQV